MSLLKQQEQQLTGPDLPTQEPEPAAKEGEKQEKNGMGVDFSVVQEDYSDF